MVRKATKQSSELRHLPLTKSSIGVIRTRRGHWRRTPARAGRPAHAASGCVVTCGVMSHAGTPFPRCCICAPDAVRVAALVGVGAETGDQYGYQDGKQDGSHDCHGICRDLHGVIPTLWLGVMGGSESRGPRSVADSEPRCSSEARGLSPSARVFVGVPGGPDGRQFIGSCCPWCARRQWAAECTSASSVDGTRGPCAGRTRGQGVSSSGSPTTHHSSVSESV